MPRIKFFARFREEIGRDSIDLNVDDVSLKEVIDILSEGYPKVKDFVEEGFLAVNREIVKDLSVKVKRDDEIAFLPKFSGG